MSETEIAAAIARFDKLAHDASGWNALYRDPTSGELWELTYPRSEMHGGGPRMLSRVNVADMADKYTFEVK